MHKVASFSLGENTELRLLTDSNLSQVELYYGDELQELVGTANTLFVTDDEGRIVLDTIRIGSSSDPQYVVRTYDRSSTYGAEVWYVVYPYRSNEPDGPWNLLKLPTDRPTQEDAARYIH
ncbi:MAG: hypothetical protein J6Y52_00535 [Bacteroidales bacterium]|nr:hypothetical protein [Bacteroidales bacterium]